MTRFHLWYRKVPTTSTMIEVTKNYFADGDDFINADNGWIKTDMYIEVEDE